MQHPMITLSGDLLRTESPSNKRATVITDASYDHRFKVGGWAAWIRCDGDSGGLRRSGPLKEKVPSSTNAEVRAALNGVWLARNTFGATHILLQSDCMTVIQLSLGQVKAVDLCALWAAAFEREDMAGVQITARHVKGHGPITNARTHVNDWCDRYARSHMEKERARVNRYIR